MLVIIIGTVITEPSPIIIYLLNTYDVSRQVKATDPILDETPSPFAGASRGNIRKMVNSSADILPRRDVNSLEEQALALAERYKSNTGRKQIARENSTEAMNAVIAL
ncbi:hypothetical protein B7494_g7398 [Chlorociboria aeruginascens]|nr:hypothetical protein B7494_g7398 [Chlorociboria aeruginascens]